MQKVVNVGGIRPDGRSPRWFKEVRTAKVEGGYTFLLDGRAARTQYEPLVGMNREIKSEIQEEEKRAAEEMNQEGYCRG